MSWRETLGPLSRTVESVFPGDAELDRLLASRRKLRIKLGLDLTSTEVTIGNEIPLRVLGRFQEEGHTAVLILGDFTALVGDPSGRDRMRPQLDRAQVEENGRTWLGQISEILDVERAEVHRNSEWLSRLGSEEMVRLAGRMTVAQMLERDSFAKRYGQNAPIHLHELLYCLLQGYDSIAVKADVELGGSDQTFNLNVGRTLQKGVGQPPQVCVICTLLEGVDGAQKMSKSLGNSIGLRTPPKDMFGLATRVPDRLVPKYLRLATDLADPEIEALLEGDIWEAKKCMAEALVARHHGAEAAARERAEFERVFKHKQPPQDRRVVHLRASAEGSAGVRVKPPVAKPPTGTAAAPGTVAEALEMPQPFTIMILVKNVFRVSGSEAKRLVRQGAVSIDDKKITDPQQVVDVKGGEILRAGKRRYVTLHIA
ncbi:MAG: tyrosine--tRNA ligase [Planctomycetota bacterium]